MISIGNTAASCDLVQLLSVHLRVVYHLFWWYMFLSGINYIINQGEAKDFK